MKVCQIFLKVPLSLLIKHRLGFFCMRCLPTKLRVNLQFSGGLSFVCWKLCRATIHKICNCHLVEWNVHAFYLSFCLFFVFFQSRNIISGDQLFLHRENSKMDWWYCCFMQNSRVLRLGYVLDLSEYPSHKFKKKIWTFFHLNLFRYIISSIYKKEKI